MAQPIFPRCSQGFGVSGRQGITYWRTVTLDVPQPPLALIPEHALTIIFLLIEAFFGRNPWWHSFFFFLRSGKSPYISHRTTQEITFPSVLFSRNIGQSQIGVYLPRIGRSASESFLGKLSRDLGRSLPCTRRAKGLCISCIAYHLELCMNRTGIC